jgi:MATE family multidrug resistance protein
VQRLTLEKKGGAREMLVIAFPMVISQGCETVMIFTDRLFMSRLGPEQMSAVMMGGLATFMLSTFFIGLTGYSNALVAQYFGAGKKEMCGAVVTQAGIIALIGYPLILAACPFVNMLFDASGIAPQQLAPQKAYLNLMVFGLIFGLLRNCLSGFFAGIGKTHYVMIAALTSMIVNVGAVWVLIFGKFGLPAMGIRGAAIGTIIAGFAGFGVLFFIYLRYMSNKDLGIVHSFKYNADVMGRLVRFGWPAGLEMFSNLVAFTCMIGILHADGLVTATAATIVFNWDLVSFVPLVGIQIGVTSLVGRYMGAGSPDTAHKATMSGLRLGWVYSAMILITFSVFPEPLVDLFRPLGASAIFDQARPLAIFMVRVAALYVMVDTMFAIFSGALRGAGDTVWAMIITGSLHWALVPILFIVLKVMHRSARTAWVTIVCVFISFGALIIWRYSLGKWREIKVVEDALPG